MAFHILYLSYDGLTDALGQSQILAYQKHIASGECHVTIISFEKKEAFAKLGEKTTQTCKEAGINWQHFFYTKTPPVFSTAFDLHRAWQKIKEIATTNRIDIVHWLRDGNSRRKNKTSLWVEIYLRHARLVA